MKKVIKMKKLSLLGTAAALSLCMAAPAQAQLAGHNVILVHGFQGLSSGEKPNSAEVVQNGEDYWARGNYWLARAEARFDWSSDERIEGKIAQEVYNKAVELSQSGLCNDGCVMVTHSTGDLVTRYFLAHQEDWLAAAGLQPLNITAVLDFAGAGGGTEPAYIAASVASGGGTWFEKWLVNFMFGSPKSIEDIGVVYDLQPSVARSLGNEPVQVPHLRYTGISSGMGSGYIPGVDDGVIPLHSTCAAANPVAYDSCSTTIATDGEQTAVSSAPTAFRSYHYPVLMADGINHGETVGQKSGVKMTYITNDFTSNGVAMNLDTYTVDEKPWYQWWGNEMHQYVSDSENKTMSQVVTGSLSN
jgi:hypothetical protein